MVTQQLQVLLPSFIGYWFMLTFIAIVGWYAWTRIQTNFHFKWQAPALVALMFSLYGALNTSLNVYQNYKLMMYQEQLKASQGNQQQGQQASTDPVIKMKTDFLKTVEQIIANPANLTPEIKGKLTTEFSQLFPTEEDRKKSFTTVNRYYECQRFFWEDAFTAFKSKTVVKSGERKACEKEEGGFFQREKLIPAEVAKNNDEIIGKLAERKRIPSSDGKEVEVTEKMLRETLDAYIQMTNVAKQLLK